MDGSGFRFTVSACTAGTIEVVTPDGVEVWEEGKVLQQGKLWKGTWPRLHETRPRPQLAHSGRGGLLRTRSRADLRVIEGGKT